MSRSLRRLVLLVCMAVAACPLFAAAGPLPTPASTISASTAPAAATIRIGESIVALNGPWKFSIGDSPIDPATHKPLWAGPAFDDAKWEDVDLNSKAGARDPMGGFADFVPGWTAKGHPGYWGFGWYRIRVRVDSPPGVNLAITGPSDVDDAYQVYDNGVYISSFGDFSSAQPSIQYSRPMMFNLPAASIATRTGAGAQETTHIIAVRVYMQPSTLYQGDWVGGMHNAPSIGEAASIGMRHQNLWDDLIRTYLPLPVLGLVFGLLGLLALSLAFFDRTDRVYLWIGALLLIIAIGNLEAMFAIWGSLPGNFDVLFNNVVLNSLQYAGWVIVWRVWFRLRRPRWIPWALLPLTVILILASLGVQSLLPGLPVSAGSACNVVSIVVRLILAGFMLLTAIQGIRSQGIEGWLALPPILLAGISQFYTDLQFIHILPFWFPFGARIRLPEIANTLLVAVLAILLLRRLRQSIQRQRLMALDLKQAQEVQQVLIPEAIPSIPGFTMHAIYKPAGEVGGDFFQIIPVRNDGVLIVIGDVSGKGTPAAMTVSLLVGTIRTLAHYTQSPGEILTAMNYRMLARSNGGFTTCLVLRIDPDGTLTAANAGHLPPYLNGKELPVDYNLPLGLSAASTYSESTTQLAPDQQLTLLTDGVVEAQSVAGELFGFDRTAELSRLSAESIAHYAQQFGQKDDITVLTLTRIATQQPALA